MRHAPDPFAPPRKARPVRQNSLLWIIEPLERDANFTHRKMFGCDAAYLDGSLYLVVADRDEPWNGVMVCTSHDRQAALMQDVPGLVPHPQLSKWLYLPQTDEGFEARAAQLNVNNLFDRKYYSQVGFYNQGAWGAGRSATLTVRYQY